MKELFKELIAENNGKTKYVFYYLNSHTKELQPLNSIDRAFRNACRRANIAGLQFRDLRRTYSSRLHENEIDPLIIQRLLRHRSFKISEEVYIQSSTKLMKDAIERLSENYSSLTQNRPMEEGTDERLFQNSLFTEA